MLLKKGLDKVWTKNINVDYFFIYFCASEKLRKKKPSTVCSVEFWEKDINNMYPWYRDSQIGQFCGPMSATIKTESGYNDCMLALDYAAQSKVSVRKKQKYLKDYRN